MPEFCEIEREGHVLWVTINRPEVMNALHPPASSEMGKIFDEFESDPEQWIAVVTGKGDRAFSAGNDLKYQAAGGRIEMPTSGFGGLSHRFDCSKPIIAAVNGVAMGGGFEIALACDIIIASERAIFALPEPRVGLAALAGGLHRLPRQIPFKAAMGMILTGRRVDAREALSLGIANEVVPHDELIPATRKWIDQILECAPLSVRASKESVLKGLEHPTVQGALGARYEAVQMMVRSEDFTEGPRAFAEKRKPNWKGR